jgi:hypothetical protein
VRAVKKGIDGYLGGKSAEPSSLSFTMALQRLSSLSILSVRSIAHINANKKIRCLVFCMRYWITNKKLAFITASKGENDQENDLGAR